MWSLKVAIAHVMGHVVRPEGHYLVHDHGKCSL